MLNKSQIIDLIEELIIDNNTNLISPEDLRVCLEEIVNSDLNIIENQSLLGLANWDNTISYSINKTVVYDNNIYQALSTTTVGTFVEGEWNQISTFINEDLSDFLLKTNAIELDNNKKVKNIALNTNYATFDTGFYFGQNNATFGLTETFPNTGNYILEIYKNVNSNFDIYKITYLTNLNKFYIKKNTDNWVAFEAGAVYTSSNGIEKIGNDFQIGGEFNVINLDGNQFNLYGTSIFFSSAIFAGSFDGISLEANNFLLGNDFVKYIKTNVDKIEINATEVDILTKTNINGELTITNKAYYTSDPFLGGIDDLDIPTFKQVKNTILTASVGADYVNGLQIIDESTAGITIGLGGSLTQNTTIFANDFDLTLNDTNVLNFDSNVLNVTTNFGINLTSGNPTSITVNEGPMFLTTENAPIIVDSPLYILYNSTAGDVELYGEAYPFMLPHKTYVNDRIAEEVALKENLVVKNPDSTPLVWTSSNGVASFQPLSVLGAQVYYLTPTTSDVASTYKQTLTPYPSSTSLNFTNIGTTQLLTSFITDLNEPNLTSIPAGTYISHLHVDKTLGNKHLQLNTEIWECSSSGTDIQILASTGPTPIITNTGTIQEFIISYSTIQKNISSTSRIKTKLYATISGSGSNIDLSVYFGGGQDSNTSLPATAVSAQNYLLINGTQKSLDMGSFDITTNDIITASANINTVPYFDSSKMLKSSTVSYTQLEYLNSLTSNVQTQINSKQNTLSLTTNGTNGSSTLISDTLNIPTYTLQGLGGQTELNGTGLVKQTGTTTSYVSGNSADFVKGDGSLDSTVYSTSYVIPNYFRVDLNNGDDLAGVAGREDKPYRLIQTVWNLIPNGSTAPIFIEILGDYTFTTPAVDSSLAHDNVTFEFKGKITYSIPSTTTSKPLFYLSGTCYGLTFIVPNYNQTTQGGFVFTSRTAGHRYRFGFLSMLQGVSTSSVFNVGFKSSLTGTFGALNESWLNIDSLIVNLSGDGSALLGSTSMFSLNSCNISLKNVKITGTPAVASTVFSLVAGSPKSVLIEKITCDFSYTNLTEFHICSSFSGSCDFVTLNNVTMSANGSTQKSSLFSLVSNSLTSVLTVSNASILNYSYIFDSSLTPIVNLGNITLNGCVNSTNTYKVINLTGNIVKTVASQEGYPTISLGQGSSFNANGFTITHTDATFLNNGAIVRIANDSAKKMININNLTIYNTAIASGSTAAFSPIQYAGAFANCVTRFRNLVISAQIDTNTHANTSFIRPISEDTANNIARIEGNVATNYIKNVTNLSNDCDIEIINNYTF